MKDPAALIYIDKWIAATQGFPSDAKGWYLDLILFQFDKGSLPNNIDELASICRIRPSEFERFEQVFKQVLEQKFKQNSEQRLENDFAKEIIRKRELFVNKRSNAGKVSYFKKFLQTKTNDYKLINFIIQNTNIGSIDTKNEHLLEQVFKQKSELYINVNEDVIIDKDILLIKEEKNEFSKTEFLQPSFTDIAAQLPPREIELCKMIVSSKTNPRYFPTDDDIGNQWEAFKATIFNGQNTFYGWNKVYERFKNHLSYQISNNKLFQNVTTKPVSKDKWKP